jgi:colanic acid/amylovoran biosynthesis glycosyltransferase
VRREWLGYTRPAFMQRPRVALFNTQFLPYSQTFVYEELRQHQRYEVEVFARKRVLPERFPFAAVHIGGALYGALRRSNEFDRRFAAQPFSLVHGHFGTGSVYALRWAQRFGLPLCVTFHGHDVTRLLSYERFLPSNWRYSALSTSLFETMTLGLCASTELRALLLGLGVPEHKLRVHRLGIDVDAFTSGARDASRFRVAMIGRFVEKKGFTYGLRAFAEVAASRPNLELHLVGDGERERELRDLAATLGVATRVTFTGALSSGEVARLLSRTDVLLAPSVVDARKDRESGLIVVKEASASECVPIGTLHGGIPEIIDDGITGYLVAERDVSALAQALATLHDDARLRNLMGSAARAKMVREYDNRRCVARLEEYYDEAIESHRHAR